MRYLKATPPADGFDEVLYPGEIEYRTEQRRRHAGIPIEDSTWRRLGEIAGWVHQMGGSPSSAVTAPIQAACRRRRGRRAIGRDLRDLIRRMSRADPLWGAPRIHGELLKLGLTVSQATVSKYMFRSRRPPSQAWRTFLKNHAPDVIAMDFFTVESMPTRSC